MRPERRDVDYFPFYVKDGKTLFILETKYQSRGSGFFLNLLRLLATTPEHHYQIQDDADELHFFARLKIDIDSGRDMLAIMAATGKIDPELYGNYRVIASNDFLNSIKDAYRRRTINSITIEELKTRFGNKPETVVGNSITDSKNEQLSPKLDINPQSKINKIKEDFKDSSLDWRSVEAEILLYGIKEGMPNLRGDKSWKKNIGIVKARLKDGYSEQELKEHLRRYLIKKRAHLNYLDKNRIDPRPTTPMWCPNLNWRIADVFSPERMEKYYQVWIDEGFDSWVDLANEQAARQGFPEPMRDPGRREAHVQNPVDPEMEDAESNYRGALAYAKLLTISEQDSQDPGKMAVYEKEKRSREDLVEKAWDEIERLREQRKLPADAG